MEVLDELIARVDARFAARDPGLAGWADPHPDRQPRDEEYSRLLNPGKWRILVARADAWIATLIEGGVADAEQLLADAAVWDEAARTVVTSMTRLVPVAAGALPLVIARTRIGNVDDVGLTLGIGDPASVLGDYPDCGCDACDSGSQDELDRVDWGFRATLSGSFRRLSRGSMGCGRGRARRSDRLVDNGTARAWPTGPGERTGAGRPGRPRLSPSVGPRITFATTCVAVRCPAARSAPSLVVVGA